MKNVNRLANYLVLLNIRRKAYYRNLFITGGLLVFAVLASTGTLLLSEWNPRSVFLLAVIDLLFSLGFSMAWVRLELTKGTIEWVKTLQMMD